MVSPYGTMSEIQSVKRAFAILKVIATQPGSTTLGEVAHQVALPKSTVSRMLSTLERIEAVERAPHGEGFRIGPEILTLALQTPYLISVAHPYLVELAQYTGEAVYLSVLDNEQVHYVDQVQGQHNVQMRDWTGHRQRLLHIDTPGKIFLAYWPEEKREKYLNSPLKRFTPNTITQGSVLRQHLAKIRQEGYAWVREEYEEGMVSLAAPIQDQTNETVAAVSISAPAFRFPPENREDEMAQVTIETAQKISENINGDHSR